MSGPFDPIRFTVSDLAIILLGSTSPRSRQVIRR